MLVVKSCTVLLKRQGEDQISYSGSVDTGSSRSGSARSLGGVPPRSFPQKTAQGPTQKSSNKIARRDRSGGGGGGDARRATAMPRFRRRDTASSSPCAAARRHQRSASASSFPSMPPRPVEYR